MSTKLKKMFESAKSTLKNSKGQGLVEYALILVLIALVVMVAVKGVGTTANSQFIKIDSALKNQ